MWDKPITWLTKRGFACLRHKMGQYLRLYFIIFFILLFLDGAAISHADTADDNLKQLYDFIDRKQYDEAMAFIHKVAPDGRLNAGMALAAGEIYYLKGDYETAIANYINLTKAMTATGQEAPALMHNHLAQAYNKLGQKHYFPPELCLRIIYHTEKTIELTPKPQQDPRQFEFLRSIIGHYDMAALKVQMMEEGGDGKEFQMPEDYVSADEKTSALQIARQMVKEYDTAQKSAVFQTATSDKSVEDLIQLVNQRMSAIKTIHFKRVDTANGALTPLEEVTYKSPDKLKAVEPEAISVISGSDYSVIDPVTNKISQQEKIDTAKLSLLKGIGFCNLRESMDAYDLTVDKIQVCPDFLGDLCKDHAVNLYLVTGRLKDKDKGPYPPTPKVEYFIDGQTGLCVAKREYWLGVLGSGKEEELAKETIITQTKQLADGTSLPSAGVTKGHVHELANLNQEWKIESLSVNQEIDDQTFNVAK